MAKGAYVGVGGVARKIKGGYVGVGGVARKIKMAYIGVGGVARPCWGGGKPAAYGAITGLQYGRENFPAGSVGNYAIFGYGYNAPVDGNNRDDYNSCYTVYDNKLVQSSVANPVSITTNNAGFGSCASVSNYAVFGGVSNSLPGNGVYAYNASLTKTTASVLSTARSKMGAAATSTYILFSGGLAGSARSNVVEAYSTSLTKNTSSYSLSSARYGVAATNFGQYALFGGGATGYNSETSVVDCFDSSLTRTKLTNLYYPDNGMGYDGEDWVGYEQTSATSVKNYALFGGGRSCDADGYYQGSNVVTGYDTSLTRKTNIDRLSTGRYALAATSLADNAIFGGGELLTYDVENGPSNAVDCYDGSLTHTTLGGLSVARHSLSATSVGNFALFAGGASYNMGGAGNVASERGLKTVDAYTLV